MRGAFSRFLYKEACISTYSGLELVYLWPIWHIILLHEKFMQFDWLRAVVFQLNLKYLEMKIANLLRVVVSTNNRMICT